MVRRDRSRADAQTGNAERLDHCSRRFAAGDDQLADAERDEASGDCREGLLDQRSGLVDAELRLHRLD